MKKIIVLCALSMAIIAGGCSNKSKEANNSIPKASISTEASTNKEFTLDELKKYNGQNGNPAYVAVDGVVYDVTHAKDWKNGKHKDGIIAGKDLSEVINQSPHGKDVLKDLAVVGKLK